jgi:hypothetical protein
MIAWWQYTVRALASLQRNARGKHVASARHDTGPFQIGLGIGRDNWLNVSYVVM